MVTTPTSLYITKVFFCITVEKIAADSSTLILLAKVTLLRDFTAEKNIVITSMVEAEVLKKKELEDAQIISALLKEKRIRKYNENIQFQQFMKDFRIEAGEAEALALAYHDKIILATDNSRAIKACKILGVKFITAIHCLIYLVKKGKIDRTMGRAKLKNLERFGRYNMDIIKDAKYIIEGEKND